MIPPRTKCKLTWDVFKVLHFLKDISFEKVNSENINMETSDDVYIKYY